MMTETSVSYGRESVTLVNGSSIQTHEWRLSKGDLRPLASPEQLSKHDIIKETPRDDGTGVTNGLLKSSIIVSNVSNNNNSYIIENKMINGKALGKKCSISLQAQSKVMGAGPDVMAPAEREWATDRDEAVCLRMSTSGQGALRPVSVVSAFRDTVKNYPNHNALGAKVNGEWKMWTFKQYYEDVWQAAKALIHLGLEPYHGVGILGFNSPEWFISNFATIFAGGLSTGIYSTNSPDACCYVAQNAKCDVIIVENDAQLQKILKVRAELPNLKAIVQYHGQPKQAYPQVYSWSEFMGLADNVDDSALDQRISQQSINKCCCLIYTSGTTGNPKGVMLSQDNVTWTGWIAGQTVELVKGEESLVSYLPLSHIAAQILDMYIPLMHAATVYFAQPDALKGSLIHTLREVRPTAFLGVPRVWEKMQEQLESVTSKSSHVKRYLLNWARSIGLQGNLSKMNGGAVPFGWRLANSLIFKKIRIAMGLDKCKICMTAAAPIMRETLLFFASLDMPLMEIYGMSETSGPHTMSTKRKWRLGSIGTSVSGTSVELIGGRQEEGGEVCMRGRNIFMGYLDETEKTLEALDSRGFMHSGDLGKKDEEGFFYITGRIKELLITAGGENVAPVPIEDAVKEALPCVSNCMLVGDKKKFLSVLLTLKTEVDKETNEPRDELTQVARDWLKAHGSDVTTVSQLLEKPNEMIMQAIQEGINQANRKAVSRAQIIQKFSIVPKDFSIAGGELGPTLKLKRPVVLNMYQSTIDAFYTEL